jgi:hypothetical protein
VPLIESCGGIRLLGSRITGPAGVGSPCSANKFRRVGHHSRMRGGYELGKDSDGSNNGSRADHAEYLGDPPGSDRAETGPKPLGGIHREGPVEVMIP